MDGQTEDINAIDHDQPSDESSTCKLKICPFPKRFILVLMGFFGYNILYMLRVNLSVAIVSMVADKSTNNQSMIINDDNSDKFDWNENIQALILSSFFVGYVITQYPGGRLADTFGSKWFFGIGIFVTSILTIISPFAARAHHFVFIACRLLEGLFEGLAYPCMHSILAKWLPLYERSRMATFIYSGSQIGTVLTMPIAALLCDSKLFGGWPSVFYVFGSIGLVWSIVWFCIIHESPEIHPSIEPSELQLIVTKRNNDLTKEKPKLPWRNIVKSIPLWALVVAHFGQNWGFYTFLTQLPRYFKNVLHFDIKENGLYSSLPYLCQALVGCTAGYICDKLYAGQYFSLSTIRKTFNTLAFIGPTICLLVLTRIGTGNSIWCIILFTTALGINGMCLAGYHVTHVDMSPTFASSLMGITNCIANFAGILAPYVVGVILTHIESSSIGWNYVFYFCCLIYVLAALIFAVFGSNEKQKWDKPEREESIE